MSKNEFLVFNDVSFKYPPIEGDLDENENQVIPSFIFEHFSAQLPEGFTSIIGPNGCGKSTLMLLASGRLKCETGNVFLYGIDPVSLEEESKNLLASVIYQNMEFETEDKVSDLLKQVFENGGYKGEMLSLTGNFNSLYDEVIFVFELKDELDKELKNLSKGQMQRVLLAFSVLYGSKSIFMDEPLYAMEDNQKEKSLEYLAELCKSFNVSIYISMHELDLTRKYAQNVLLMKPNRDMVLGTPEEVMTSDELESAYGVPASMLKHQESMTRDNLNQWAQSLK